LIDYVLFYVPLKSFSLIIMEMSPLQWNAAKFKSMLSAQGFWAGRDLYRAKPTVTRDLRFSGLIRRTVPFNHLLRHARGCGGSILTRILTGITRKKTLWLNRPKRLIDNLMFYVSLKNFSFIWKQNYYRWRAAKYRTMLGVWRAFEQGGVFIMLRLLWHVQDLRFSGLIWKTAPLSRLLWHTRGCGWSTLTRILTSQAQKNKISSSG
jgi:hypothetical protein